MSHDVRGTGSTKAIGRPRATPGKPGASAREDLLDAAAVLFAGQGYAGTSTRQIADGAGLRQATLYYYFGGKEEILLELLQRSVSPTLERAREFLELADPVVALVGLVRADVETLMRDPHNIGILYLSPEVAGPAFEPFRETRRELAGVYVTLLRRIAAATGDRESDPDLDGLLCIHQVESVIGLRRAGLPLTGVADAVVRACLRSAGVPGERISELRDA